MKILGNSPDGCIVELSREEMAALCVRPFEYEGVPVAGSVDILPRLRPTVNFERDASSGPRMVEHLRSMASELEKGFAELRADR